MKYAPRKKKDGRWDFTQTDDAGFCSPFGFCKEYWDRGNKDGHHDSPQAAVQCFLHFLLERCELDYNGVLLTMLPCWACGSRTLNAVMKDKELFMVLCREHATPRTAMQMIEKNMVFEVVPEMADNPEDPTPDPNLDIPGAFHEAVRTRSKSR